MNFNNKKIVFYHATSSNLAEKIKEKGLLPRNTTHLIANWAEIYLPEYYSGITGYESRPDAVYLSKNIENTKIFARQAIKARGGFPVVFKIFLEKKDLEKLGADDDLQISDKKDWRTSLEKLGKCCYFGAINKESVQFLGKIEI